MIHTDFDMGGI